MKRVAAVFIAIGVIVLSFQSCSVSLNGASIPLGLKTINIQYFENNAPFVVNYLSQQFTEAIKDRVRNTTRLAIVQGESDAQMSGSITGYTIEPISVQATNNTAPPIAGAERVTLTVNVTYTNIVDKKLNFTQSFSAHQDFQGDIASQEQKLITLMNKQLTEDIFNRAFANW